MFNLQPPRHIPTLPDRDQVGAGNKRRFGPTADFSTAAKEYFY